MSSEPTTPTRGPVIKWAIRFGAAGFFGGLLVGLSQDGSVAFAVGMAIPTGLFAAFLGAVIGLIFKAARK